jgi:hypothetical protein
MQLLHAIDEIEMEQVGWRTEMLVRVTRGTCGTLFYSIAIL